MRYTGSHPTFDSVVRQQYGAGGRPPLRNAVSTVCAIQGKWRASLETSALLTRFGFAPWASRTSIRSNLTRGRIEQQIAKLRDLIASSALSDDRQKALPSKLDELSVELSQPRVSFGKMFVVLAAVAAGVSGTTSFLANAPQAIATIKISEVDKADEDAEIERLGSPATPRSLPSSSRALPSPEPRPIKRRSEDLDDEIPF